MSEFKLCPFCGCRPHLIFKGELQESVVCGNCEADEDQAAQLLSDKWNARHVDDAMRVEIDRLKDENSRLLAEQAKLQAALMPFAELHEFVIDTPEGHEAYDDRDVFTGPPPEYHGHGLLKVRDFRRAREALEGSE